MGEIPVDHAASPPPSAPSPLSEPEVRPFGRAALLVALLITAVFFFVTLAPIAAPVLLGTLLAGFSLPFRNWLGKRLRNRTPVAATVTLTMLLFVLGPLALLVAAVVDRVQSLLAPPSPLIGFFKTGGAWQDLVKRYPFLERFSPERLADQLAGGLQFIAGSLPQVVTGLANGVIGLFLAAITVFYLSRDGDRLFRRIEHALPLEPRHTRAIFNEFERVGRAFIIGTLGTAALQGFLAGIAYWLLGLTQALLLGVLTGVVAVVPVGGSGLVWGPVAIYLFATGSPSKALLLIGFGALVVGTVDNIVRPILNRGGLDVHPLFMFLGIFGGLAAFGASGLYLGPLFVALFMAVAHIYEREIAPSATTSPRNEDEETTSVWRAVQALRRGRGRKS